MIANAPIFNIHVDLEEEIIFKIYQRFTFVNEDILKH